MPPLQLETDWNGYVLAAPLTVVVTKTDIPTRFGFIDSTHYYSFLFHRLTDQVAMSPESLLYFTITILLGISSIIPSNFHSKTTVFARCSTPHSRHRRVIRNNSNNSRRFRAGIARFRLALVNISRIEGTRCSIDPASQFFRGTARRNPRSRHSKIDPDAILFALAVLRLHWLHVRNRRNLGI